jgi:hypothetical protein
MIFHENHLPNRKLILETSPQPKKHVPWGKLTLGISDRFCGASWMRGAAGLGAAHRCETSTFCRSVSLGNHGFSTSVCRLPLGHPRRKWWRNWIPASSLLRSWSGMRRDDYPTWSEVPRATAPLRQGMDSLCDSKRPHERFYSTHLVQKTDLDLMDM